MYIHYLRSSDQQRKCLVKDLDHLRAQQKYYSRMIRSLVLQVLTPEKISWLQLTTFLFFDSMQILSCTEFDED